MLYKNWDTQYLRKPKTKNKLTAYPSITLRGLWVSHDSHSWWVKSKNNSYAKHNKQKYHMRQTP